MDTEYDMQYKTEEYTEPIEIATDTSVFVSDLMPILCWNSPDLKWTGKFEYYYRETNPKKMTNIKELTNVWYYGYEIPDTVQPYTHVRIKFPERLQQQEVREFAVYDITEIGHITSPGRADLVPGCDVGNCLDQDGNFSKWLRITNSELENVHYLGGESYYQFRINPATEFDFDPKGAKMFAVLIVGPQYQWNIAIDASLIRYDNTNEQQPVTKKHQVSYQASHLVPKEEVIYKSHYISIGQYLFNYIREMNPS
jgi:hypothetical protein